MNLQADEAFAVVLVTLFIIRQICDGVAVDPGLDFLADCKDSVFVPAVVLEVTMSAYGLVL